MGSKNREGVGCSTTGVCRWVWLSHGWNGMGRALTGKKTISTSDDEKEGKWRTDDEIEWSEPRVRLVRVVLVESMVMTSWPWIRSTRHSWLSNEGVVAHTKKGRVTQRTQRGTEIIPG